MRFDNDKEWKRNGMKTFLTAWMTEAPKVLARELAGTLELRPSSQLPRPETATTLSVQVGGPLSGRFLITTDRYALHALFTAAKVTDGTLDADRDRDLWRGILQMIAEDAARTAGSGSTNPVTVSMEDAEWKLGLPSAAWELGFGETVLLMAFTDEVEPVIQPPVSAGAVQKPEPVASEKPVPPPNPVSSPPAPSSAPRIVPGGVELLLGVELETSLRFGSREMPLNEVLSLGAGDVVELDRNVTDPVDLLVGDKIVARGEVVLVNGSFGLRVLEVVEPKKRLESVRCLF